MDWNRLLIRTADVDAPRLLGFWSWLLREPYHPLVLSKFGDWFLMDRAGRVHWLDLLEGSLTEVAPSGPAFQGRLADPAHVDDWFLPGWVDALWEAGQVPGAGQCYGFRVPPRLGGAVDLANVAVADLAAYQAWMAQVHRVPPGATVSGLAVDGQR